MSIDRTTAGSKLGSFSFLNAKEAIVKYMYIQISARLSVKLKGQSDLINA